MTRRSSANTKRGEWIRQYQVLHPLYGRLCSKHKTLIEDLLAAERIPYHAIEARLKTAESFAEKVQRDGKSYLDPLKEVTDLAGLRVILYYLEDVDKAATLVEREFQVDHARSIDKRALLAPDQFGYLSVHKIVRVSESRSGLPEWDGLGELVAEIQIRTVLQHSWAAIHQALAYKREVDVPAEFRRRLVRIAGLLELADQEFDSLRKSQQALSRQIAERVAEGDLDLSINVDSLAEFLASSSERERISSSAAAGGMDMSTEASDADPSGMSQLAAACAIANLTTIGSLQRALASYSKKSITGFFKRLVSRFPTATVRGSAAHAAAVLVAALHFERLSTLEALGSLGWAERYRDAVIAAARGGRRL